MNTVYVGDLDEGINEEMIKQHFSSCGQVNYVRLLKSHQNNSNRGFGFVTYANESESEASIKKLNLSCIMENRIRVCKYKTSIDKSANLFIKNITKDMSVQQLNDLFLQFGPVFSLKIARTQEGDVLNYGYVQFETTEAKKKCLEYTGELSLLGHTLETKEFVRSTDRKQNRNNIYLKNLPIMAEEEIKALLMQESQKYGKVSSIISKVDAKTKKPFAFVCFEEYESATKAFQELQNLSLDNENKLYVSWSQKKTMRSQKLLQEFKLQKHRSNLYMKNLLETVDEEQLKEVFSKYGVLTSVAIKEPTSTPAHIQTKTMFAFVNYSSHEEARKLLDKLKTQKDCEEINALFNNNQVQIMFHKSKEQMKKQKEKEQNSNKKQQQNVMQMMQNMMSNPMMMMMSNMMMNMNRPQQQRLPQQNQQMMRGMNMMPGSAPMSNNPRLNPMMHPQMMQMPMMPMQQPMNMHYMQQQQQPHMMQQQQPQQIIPQQVQQQMQQAIPVVQNNNIKITPASLRSNLSEFLKYDQEKQRAQLGELLFPLVNKYCEDKAQAPKVTGMLIDFEVFEVSEILEFLENEELLNERIQEAEELIVKSG